MSGEAVDTNAKYEKLVTIIDADKADLVDLCLQLGNTPSPHGKERVLGEATLAWLRQRGIDGELQFITDECVNAVARIRGAASGHSLIFNAHMDTGPELGRDATENEKNWKPPRCRQRGAQLRVWHGAAAAALGGNQHVARSDIRILLTAVNGPRYTPTTPRPQAVSVSEILDRPEQRIGFEASENLEPPAGVEPAIY
jgi:hypothetical protein